MLNKKQKLITNADFQQVYASGKSINSTNLRLCFDFQTDHFQGGVVTSKKIGKAYLRNRLRRQISHILAEPELDFNLKLLRLIVVCKPGAAKLDFAALRTELIAALDKIRYPETKIDLKQENQLAKILAESSEKLMIVADFDRTLTLTKINGKFRPSLQSIIRDDNYLGKEFTEWAIAEANKFMPIEKDPNYPYAEKKKLMHDWFANAFAMMIQHGMRYSHIKRVVASPDIALRTGIRPFLQFLNQQHIPLVIVSGSNIGEAIPLLLAQEKLLFPNIKFVINQFNWSEDSDPKAISVQEPFIYSMNKGELDLEHYGIAELAKLRKNIILLGDVINDLEIAKSFPYEKLFSVCFVDAEAELHLTEYKKAFDLLVHDEGSLEAVLRLLTPVKSKLD